VSAAGFGCLDTIFGAGIHRAAVSGDLASRVRSAAPPLERLEDSRWHGACQELPDGHRPPAA
jgi:flavin-dependent dehydrogenase